MFSNICIFFKLLLTKNNNVCHWIIFFHGNNVAFHDTELKIIDGTNSSVNIPNSYEYTPNSVFTR